MLILFQFFCFSVSDGETNLFKSDKLALQESLSMVRKKEREYIGMFEIKSGDVDVMLKHLLGK